MTDKIPSQHTNGVANGGNLECHGVVNSLRDIDTLDGVTAGGRARGTPEVDGREIRGCERGIESQTYERGSIHGSGACRARQEIYPPIELGADLMGSYSMGGGHTKHKGLE